MIWTTTSWVICFGKIVPCLVWWNCKVDKLIHDSVRHQYDFSVLLNCWPSEKIKQAFFQRMSVITKPPGRLNFIYWNRTDTKSNTNCKSNFEYCGFRFGRKPTFLFFTYWQFIIGLCLSFAQSFTSYAIFFFLSGTGAFINYMVAAVIGKRLIYISHMHQLTYHEGLYIIATHSRKMVDRRWLCNFDFPKENKKINCWRSCVHRVAEKLKSSKLSQQVFLLDYRNAA